MFKKSECRFNGEKEFDKTVHFGLRTRYSIISVSRFVSAILIYSTFVARAPHLYCENNIGRTILLSFQILETQLRFASRSRSGNSFIITTKITPNQ